MDILRHSLCAALLFLAGKSAGMEEPESDEIATYDDNLWSIHGTSIEIDSEALQVGLEALQLTPQTLFNRKISNEADRQVLYAFYALSRHMPCEQALSKQTFEQIASLARSFYLLRHRLDIRPYFAANLFSATSKQFHEYCEHKTDVDEAAITAFLSHPQCMYQRAPHTTPQIDTLKITYCGKNPIAIEHALWSINPHDEQELWYAPLTHGSTSAIKRLTKNIAALCGSKKDLFAATYSGAVIRPYYENQKILCDEIIVCDHAITHIASTELGTFIIAGDSDCLSIIVRSNGSYRTHKISQLSLQSVGIRDNEKSYWAIAVGAPLADVKKNILTYLSICPTKEPCLIKKMLTLAQEVHKNCTVGINNTVHCAITIKSDEQALTSIHTDMIPELAQKRDAVCHIPHTAAHEIVPAYTNPTGTLSTASIVREKTKKSWIIWDHTTDEIHELPDNDYDVAIPESVSPDGTVSILAGSAQGGYARITINARPHLSFINDPKSSFKSKLLLLAAIGAHCIEGILNIEDDPHWKAPFDEIPGDLQKALTELYPVYTKSLLGGPGKSIIK